MPIAGICFKLNAQSLFWWCNVNISLNTGQFQEDFLRLAQAVLDLWGQTYLKHLTSLPGGKTVRPPRFLIIQIFALFPNEPKYILLPLLIFYLQNKKSSFQPSPFPENMEPLWRAGERQDTPQALSSQGVLRAPQTHLDIVQERGAVPISNMDSHPKSNNLSIKIWLVLLQLFDCVHMLRTVTTLIDNSDSKQDLGRKTSPFSSR